MTNREQKKFIMKESVVKHKHLFFTTRASKIGNVTKLNYVMALISKENFSTFQGSQIKCIDADLKVGDISIELLRDESISQNTFKLSNKVGATTTAEIRSLNNKKI